MAIKNKSILKTYFQAGSKPTQQNFADLIDSFTHISAAPAGMFFPAAPSITTSDVGKLVILKDGKAQLPEFVPAAPGTPGVVIYNLSLSSFQPFDEAYVDFEFLSQPADGDTIREIAFKTSPDGSQVQIGGTIAETIDNFIDLFETSYETDGLKTASRTGNTLRIKYHGDGKYGYDSYFEDVLEGITHTGSFCTRTAPINTATARLGSCLIPFLFMRATGLLNGAYHEDYSAFYTETSAFSRSVRIGGYTDGNFPADLDELKAGIIENLLKHDGVLYADFYNDDDLTIGPTIDVNLVLETTESDDRFWYNAFDNGVVVAEPVPATPSYCNYPLLGLVKSVQGSQVEIHTDPICTFRSSFDEEVNWTSLMDHMRVWALDPENPGYLRPAFSNEINAIEDLFNIAAPGYVFSLEHTVAANTTFTGAFSTEMFALQVFYMIIQSSEEEE